MQKNEMETSPHTIHKNKLKWIKDLKVRVKIPKIQGEKFLTLALVTIFWSQHQKHRQLKPKETSETISNSRVFEQQRKQRGKGNLWKGRKYLQSKYRDIYIHIAICIYIYEVKSLSRVRLFATLQIVARWAPMSMGFSRQEHWSGLPFPTPGDIYIIYPMFANIYIHKHYTLGINIQYI